MRRIIWLVTIVIVVVSCITGCGKKDATAVVKDLDKVIRKLDSYAVIGTMTLHSGKKPLEYRVEVWYQNPSYYRIELKNEKKDITQIVLRNKEGVFVLTPSLNKIFRFQSDWPKNQGQVYLYQTLVRSILSDNARQFTAEGDHYLFEVAANYQTDSLVRQKIWLSKNSYAPKKVQVTDSDDRIVVEMKFNQFDFGKKFNNHAFDMQRNMASMKDAITLTDIQDDPAVKKEQLKDFNPSSDKSTTNKEIEIEEGTGSETTGSEERTERDGKGEAELGPFGIIEPSYLPQGVTKEDEIAVPDSKEHAVILRYKGAYHFALMEARPKDIEVGVITGSALDLGFTIGHLTGKEQKTLTWVYEGVKYKLASSDLPTSEMVKIAQSMVDQSGK